MLKHFQRDDLNRRARRTVAVLHPLKLVIDNYPVGQVEEVEVQNNPEDPSAGTRQVPFSREPISSRTTSAKFLPPSTTASRLARRSACATPISSPTPGKLVFSRKLALKDSWAKIVKKAPLQGADAC
jgi:glutamyl/glutaminyl-tRNA synthetase